MAVTQLRQWKHVLPVFAAALLGASFPASAADEADTASPLKLSGFASIVAGKTFGASLSPDYRGITVMDGHPCPCWIADWSTAGVYDGDLSFKPESRAGLQASYRFSDKLSAVTQIVVRGTEPKPSVEWAYAAYEVDKHWEVQVGRKRIPLYYYSDFQDVGSAYPWIGVPPELYGWEAVNYNGGSVRYKGKLAGTTFTAGVFGGKETVKESKYYKLYSDEDTKVNWNNIVGADLEASRGPLTVRGVYLQSKVSTSSPSGDMDSFARLRAYGLAANLDFDDWFVLSEVTRLTRDFGSYEVAAPAFTIGAGYRWGNWTPFVNFARYTEKTNDLDAYDPQSYQRASFTLRYDLDARSSIKAQVDRFEDTTRNFGDNANVIRLSYDRLF